MYRFHQLVCSRFYSVVSFNLDSWSASTFSNSGRCTVSNQSLLSLANSQNSLAQPDRHTLYSLMVDVSYCCSIVYFTFDLGVFKIPAKRPEPKQDRFHSRMLKWISFFLFWPPAICPFSGKNSTPPRAWHICGESHIRCFNPYSPICTLNISRPAS